ncbi:F-box protein CPR1-like [Papaver somniferum]|uniref:F-box protein CPR1-like n=1 Tax=Papaver somniferum TaxID=3469 RepID=UPI000E703414|nr:F-box protein CPR1-like [Papaver somniferum]
MDESCCLGTPIVVLPEDVIFQILIWLPVQSLLRFKSVCRSWYALIKSSHFIQSHITATAVDDMNSSRLGGTFICRHQLLETRKPTPSFYLLSEKGGFKKLEDLGKRLGLKDVRQFCALQMEDSVHGIICLLNTITRDIFLWNPATRQCRLLPKSSDGNPKVGYNHYDFVGLGFDVKSKDYKVIQVSYFGPKENDDLIFYSPRKVHIYCLSTDSWRLIDSDFRIQCGCPTTGQSLNGIYFHEAVDHIADPHQKVWILNDYNTVKESWSKLYEVDLMSPRLQTRYGWCRILANSYSGKFDLMLGKTLVCYNSITDEFEDLGLGKGMKPSYVRATIYKESLVSVDANSSATKDISS